MDEDSALNSIREAYQKVAEDLQKMPDSEAAYRIATELADGMRELADAAALTRAKSAERIKETEHLSLGSLAARIGVTKSRAAQLLRAAKRDTRQKISSSSPKET